MHHLKNLNGSIFFLKLTSQNSCVCKSNDGQNCFTSLQCFTENRTHVLLSLPFKIEPVPPSNHLRREAAEVE